MKITTNVLSVFKACAAFLVRAIGILFSADDDENEDRPLGNGSDQFGEHNFRTGRLDSGSDPDGWYEEDL